MKLTKQIWQTTAKEMKMREYEESLRLRIYLRRLPRGIDKVIDRTIEAIQLLLADPSLDKDRRASLASDCSKTITQYKFDLMTINLDTIQNIRCGEERLLIDLKNILSQSNMSDALKQAIENRQQAMRTRHETYVKHKLNTFFDEAPTAAKQ
jgi:hypothetical protein